nr:hypothetical protein [Tanacetum cinerariifolium]
MRWDRQRGISRVSECQENVSRMKRDMIQLLVLTRQGFSNSCSFLKPKRPRNAAWYKDKAMLVEAHKAGQILDEEQLAFLVDPGVPDGRTLTLVKYVCTLTRITKTAIMPFRKHIPIESNTSKPVVTLVVQVVLWYLDSGCSMHMTGDRSQLINFVQKFLGMVKFENDHVAKIMGYVEPNNAWGSNAIDIPLSSSLVMTCYLDYSLIARIMGYGDYQLGNVTISRLYYVEGLGHNLFSVGQFCDADLEVIFQKMTCFIRNLEASKTKIWLCHRRLSHLNFGTLNKLAKYGLARGIPRLKFQKDHLCSACALGKINKSSHHPKAEDTNQKKLYLLHMDLYGPICMASINGKSSGPGLHYMTLATSSSGLISNPVSQEPSIPPIRNDWDHLFQPMFDEYFNPPLIIVSLVQEAHASRAVVLADSPVSTSIDHDAPSISIPSTQEQEHSPNIS